MTADIRNALALQVVSGLEHDAEMFSVAGCIEDSGVCKEQAAAIRELVAHATEMQAVMKAKDRNCPHCHKPLDL